MDLLCSSLSVVAEGPTSFPPSNDHRGHVASRGKVAAFNRDSDTVSVLPPQFITNVLLSQRFSFTSKGPVYLGARLGLASLSSRTYTNLAVRRVLATNLRKSRARGEKEATLDLAWSSWSAADRGGDCSSWKHNPGIWRGVP